VNSSSAQVSSASAERTLDKMSQAGHRPAQSDKAPNALDLSVVIPVRDEEENLAELVSRLQKVLDGLRVTSEIIFVTDHNTDCTFEVLKTLSSKEPRIKIIKLSQRHGQYVAIMAGIHMCRGDAVVVMDGDLQDCPEDIPKLYDKFQEGYDVVYATKKSKNDLFVRNILSRLFNKVLNLLSDQDVEFNTYLFRALSRRVVDELKRFREKEIFLTGLVALMGFPTTSVQVTSGRRVRGKTKWGFLRQANLAVTAILSFSSKPIRMVSAWGFAVSALSLLYLCVVIVERLAFGMDVPGWATLVSLITFLGGIQLLAIGVVGEYVGRIFIETKDRPLYIVEEIVGDS